MREVIMADICFAAERMAGIDVDKETARLKSGMAFSGEMCCRRGSRTCGS